MTVIARTNLSLLQARQTKYIEARLHAPEQVAEGRWQCRSEIDWPERPNQFSAEGVTSMQALVRGLQALGAGLYASRAHKQGRLNGGHTGYGIPVPPSVRPHLIGYDKRYL